MENVRYKQTTLWGSVKYLHCSESLTLILRGGLFLGLVGSWSVLSFLGSHYWPLWHKQYGVSPLRLHIYFLAHDVPLPSQVLLSPFLLLSLCPLCASWMLVSPGSVVCCPGFFVGTWSSDSCTCFMSCHGFVSRPCEVLGPVLDVDSPPLIPGLSHLMIHYGEPRLFAYSVYIAIVLIAWEISPTFCYCTAMELLTHRPELACLDTFYCCIK